MGNKQLMDVIKNLRNQSALQLPSAELAHERSTKPWEYELANRLRAQLGVDIPGFIRLVYNATGTDFEPGDCVEVSSGEEGFPYVTTPTSDDSKNVYILAWYLPSGTLGFAYQSGDMIAKLEASVSKDDTLGAQSGSTSLTTSARGKFICRYKINSTKGVIALNPKSAVVRCTDYRSIIELGSLSTNFTCESKYWYSTSLSLTD